MVWAGDDIEDRASALLDESVRSGDMNGECAALYALTAQAAFGSDQARTRDRALRLTRRATECDLPVWQSLGHQYTVRAQLHEGHEAIAIQELALAELLLDDVAPDIVVVSALNGIAAAYSALSLYEECERLYGRAVDVLADVDDPWARQALTYNRLLNEATWAVALQRVGEDAQALERITQAAARHRAGPQAATDGALRSGLDALLLFSDLLTGDVDPEAAERVLDELTASHALESASYVRYALAHRLAAAQRFEDARAQVALGLVNCDAIDGEQIRVALVWLRARIAVDEQPEHEGCQDIWAYAQDQTAQVWQLRTRRHASAQDRRTMERLQRAHAQVERQSLEDPLTGTANRRRLDLAREELAVARSAGWAAVFYIDIDHFKTVNDTFGHDVGDVILRTMASLLQGQTRDGDLIGRYGGDEMVIVAPACSPQDADRLATRLLGVVRSHTWDALAPDLTISISVGVATGQTPSDELFTAADRALYEAKGLGRDRAVAVAV